MKIRKATKKDFNKMIKILIEESSKPPYNEKYTKKIALKEIINLAKNELYVALEDGKIIGFIASSITPDNKEKAYINELWLKPSSQGKGIGKSLVKFIEEFYKKKKVKIIRLLAKKNSKAFGFYKKINYKEYKELVFMEKKIN
mgnify:CR=1 FL=1